MAVRGDSSSTSTDPPEIRRDARVAVLIVTGTGAGQPAPARLLRVPDAPAALHIGRGSNEGRAANDAAGVRGERQHVQLADPLLSRDHLRVARRAAELEVTDLGSRNGTFLDGRRVEGTLPVYDGSILCFGHQAAVLRFVTDGELAAIAAEARDPLGPVATTSPSFASTLAQLRRIAHTEAEILILGETGVGKEVYARALHRASGREGRFVALNCAAIPEELAESELFGYARGAHSTAGETKTGLIMTANGGTLLLDEIGDGSPRLQAKLLRFLQEREVRPVGATSGRRVDVRVLAATHTRARTARAPGLREDLLARFGAEPVTIPPLRRRMEDLAPLIAFFTAPMGGAEFRSEARRAIYCYGWPRNVRELEKVIGRAIALAGPGNPVGLEHFPESLRKAATNGPPATLPRARQRRSPPPDELKALLAAHDGNVAAVARQLDRQRTVVRRWIDKHGLQSSAQSGPGQSNDRHTPRGGG